MLCNEEKGSPPVGCRGGRSIHPGSPDPEGGGCMYILYIYPRVRAVGFSMGPNHRIRGSEPLGSGPIMVVIMGPNTMAKPGSYIVYTLGCSSDAPSDQVINTREERIYIYAP